MLRRIPVRRNYDESRRWVSIVIISILLKKQWLSYVRETKWISFTWISSLYNPSNDPDKISFKYYDIEIPHKYKSLSLFHIKACSLNQNFNIITISKTRITKQVSLSNNLNLNNDSFEFSSTETAGGTLHLS